jgi:ribonuclease HI
VKDAFISELLACREGLEAAVRLKLTKVILQTDSSFLMSLCQDVRQVRAYGAHILNELKVISQQLQAFKLLYLNRTTNFAAHVCAREALSIDSFLCFDVTPGFLLRALQADCNPDTSE